MTTQGYRLVGTLALAMLIMEPAFAGPGGKIASAALDTFWGRIIGVVLFIVFFPLIVMVLFKEYSAKRRARRALACLAQHDRRFHWLTLQQRAKACFERVHAGWQDGNLADVSEWMTSWYWQNQQQIHLDRWNREGLENVCKVKRIRSLAPLYVSHRNDGEDHEGSVVSIMICATMQDYLRESASGRIVEGSKRFKDVETIWTLILDGGDWKVADIEEGSNSLAFCEQMKIEPPVESSIRPSFEA